MENPTNGRAAFSLERRAVRSRIATRVCGDALTCEKSATSFVYVIANSHAELKIGLAGDLHALGCRLDNAKTWVPHMRVEAVFHGDAAHERRLHERFAQHRLTGEWFDAAGAVVRYLRDERYASPCEWCRRPELQGWPQMTLI